MPVLCLLTCSVGCRGRAANARYSGLATAAGHQMVSVSAWCSRHCSDTGLHGFRETIGRLFVNYSLTFPSLYPQVPPRIPLDGFPWNLVFDSFMKKSAEEIPNFVSIGRKYRAISVKTKVSYIVAGETKLTTQTVL